MSRNTSNYKFFNKQFKNKVKNIPEIIYSGPDGRLEGRMNVVENKRSPVAILLHPLPQFGGNMNNPVIFNLYHTFIKKGFSVLRFNFRGVGKGQGEFDQGMGRSIRCCRFT